MMKWQEVESSQIKEVGYDPESRVLGLRFYPNKKQKENGIEFTEYHYRNVPHHVHDELVEAESVGHYFAEYIKPFPELYPFERVD